MARRYNKKPKVRFNISCDPDLIKKLDRLADAFGKSRSQVVVECIEDSIGQQELASKVLRNPLLTQTLFKGLANPEVIRGMMRAMGQEADPKQLRMFQDAVQKVGDDLNKTAGAKA